MIHGRFSDKFEAVLEIRLRGSNGVVLRREDMIDSGYNGTLTLPVVDVAALELEYKGGGRATMADGAIVAFDIFTAEILWEGVWRPIPVSAVGEGALVGMRLLEDHRLSMDVRPGGTVEITPLP
jgi:predicted aspartyl protease